MQWEETKEQGPDSHQEPKRDEHKARVHILSFYHLLKKVSKNFLHWWGGKDRTTEKLEKGEKRT